jgi:hypothetical protein
MTQAYEIIEHSHDVAIVGAGGAGPNLVEQPKQRPRSVWMPDKRTQQEHRGATAAKIHQRAA